MRHKFINCSQQHLALSFFLLSFVLIAYIKDERKSCIFFCVKKGGKANLWNFCVKEIFSCCVVLATKLYLHESVREKSRKNHRLENRRQAGVDCASTVMTTAKKMMSTKATHEATELRTGSLNNSSCTSFLMSFDCGSPIRSKECSGKLHGQLCGKLIRNIYTYESDEEMQKAVEPESRVEEM